MRRLVVAVILALLAAAPARADMEAGVAAYERGDYATALREWRPFAEAGHAQSQFMLGAMYAGGQGGVAKDDAEAARWLRKAADQGEALAQLMLGAMYFEGRGVAKDDAEAVKWWRKAADQGIASAQYNLGVMYADGRGVTKDDAEAVRWYRKAAEQGYAEAQYTLGVRYAKGQGVPRDDVQAYMWFNLAAGQGDAQAIKGRDGLAKFITPAQIAEAQRLAREWKPKKETPPTGQVVAAPAPRPVAPEPLVPPADLDFGRYHALVIGNDAYRSLPRLESAVADAEAVAALLRDAYGYQATLLKDASRVDIIRALDGLRAGLAETDNLLVYYAGHGWLDRDSERGYWLPVEASSGDRSGWLSNADITDSLKAIRAKHVMVVADSCYSGTLTRGPDEMRGLELVGRPADHFSRMLGKKVRAVLTSGALEPVSDRGGGRHSVFAKAFMDALRDNPGVKDGIEIFARVREQVRLNAPQVPQYANIQFAGHELGGDFLFVRRQ